METNEFEVQIIERLTRIETMLTSAVSKSDDHEKRIRSLESFKWVLVGVCLAGGGAGGAIASAILGNLH